MKHIIIIALAGCFFIVGFLINDVTSFGTTTVSSEIIIFFFYFFSMFTLFRGYLNSNQIKYTVLPQIFGALLVATLIYFNVSRLF